MCAEKYMPAKVVAQQLGVEADLVDHWCRSGALTANRFPDTEGYWIPESALDTFLRTTRVLPASNGISLIHPEMVHALAERLVRALIPGQSIEQVGGEDKGIRIFIHRPTVQRIEVYWRQDEGQWQIQLWWWPSDTLAQARVFWRQVDTDAFLALKKDQNGSGTPWKIDPCPHISFIRQHFVYGFDTGTIEDYCRFWQANQEAMRQYGREEGGPDFTALREVLDQIHPLTPKGSKEFQKHFLGTDRQTANLIPGLSMGLTISYQEAQQLEAAGVLVEQIRGRLHTAMATWGETLA